MKYMKIPLYTFEVFVEKFDEYFTKPTNKEIAKNRPDLTFNQIVKSSAKLKEFLSFTRCSDTIYFLADNELFYYSDIFRRFNGEIEIDERDKVRGAKDLYIIQCWWGISNKEKMLQQIDKNIDKNKAIFEFVELDSQNEIIND